MVFGILNAKNLAYSIPNVSALKKYLDERKTMEILRTR